MGGRHRARELALQMLYRHELSGGDPRAMADDFDELRKAPEATRRFAVELANGVLENLEALDGELSIQTANWRLERLAAVDRNILRLAAFELLNMDTPPAVVIDEAIELAKRFGSGESARFVNGVLDGLRRRKAGE